MKQGLAIGAALAAALSLGVGVAEAHPRLLGANPAAGARVASPSQLRLSFSETLIGRFSKLSLTTAAGRPAALGQSALSPDHKQLVAPIQGRLAPGRYQVHWSAVSTDTHRVQGAYAFLVTR